MASKSLLIIGSGPGGMAAALAGAARGWHVRLVDEAPIGGTCLNRGCIPSKFLLARAKPIADALKLRSSGISMRLESIELSELWHQKDLILGTLRQRLQQAAKTAHVETLQGHAGFLSPHSVQVTRPDGTYETIEADTMILATGSTPIMPASFPSHPAIRNSTTLFDLNYLPAHLVVLGGGYIGCELACAFQGLGSKVTLIEKESRLLATQPEFEAASGVLARSFEKRGLTVLTKTVLEKVEPIDPQRLRLHLSNGETMEANALLLALGRAPNVQGLSIEKSGLVFEKGRLTVDAYGQTTVPHIYAIGDLVSPLPLAHTAAAEAERTIAHLAGESVPLDYAKIPRCIYTWPEAAAIGWSEPQARDAGYTPRVDRYHLAASAKAMAEGETEGFWLVVSDVDSGKVLGAQIVGPHATELIHLFATVLHNNVTLNDIAHTVFAHPTLSEGWTELARRAITRTSVPSKGVPS